MSGKWWRTSSVSTGSGVDPDDSAITNGMNELAAEWTAAGAIRPKTPGRSEARAPACANEFANGRLRCCECVRAATTEKQGCVSAVATRIVP